MKPALFIACLLLLPFAGCLSPSGSEASVSSSTPASSASTSTSSSATTGPSPTPTSAPPAPNHPPTANLSASKVNGSTPLAVTFHLEGTDPDGDTLSWTFDPGAGNRTNGTQLPADVQANYTQAGNYSAILTVSDGVNETQATVNITVTAAATSGLPVPDGSITASIYWYNAVAGQGVGVSNVVSLATGAAGDPAPRYPRGTDVSWSARTVTTTKVKIDASTPCTAYVFTPDGKIANGPRNAPVSADGTAWQCSAGTFTIPSNWSGTYLLGFKLTVDGQDYWVKDASTNSGGLRKVIVV